MISRNALISGEAIVSDSDVYGDIAIEGRAQVSHSRIKGSGLNIMGDALVENVDIEVENGFIIGKTTLKNVFGRNKLTLFTMDGNARVVGLPDRHLLMGGEGISISGNAYVLHAYAILGSNITIRDDVSVEEGVTIHGKKIQLSDYARIVGRVTLRDNLSVSELGHICSPQGTSQVGNMLISGDSVVDACLL